MGQACFECNCSQQRKTNEHQSPWYTVELWQSRLQCKYHNQYRCNQTGQKWCYEQFISKQGDCCLKHSKLGRTKKVPSKTPKLKTCNHLKSGFNLSAAWPIPFQPSAVWHHQCTHVITNAMITKRKTNFTSLLFSFHCFPYIWPIIISMYLISFLFRHFHIIMRSS